MDILKISVQRGDYNIMARGIRKTPLEKLQLEIDEVRESIAQYESCLEIMKEKEKSIQEQIELEEFKELKCILNEQGLTMEEIKELIRSQNNNIQQSA